MWNVRSLVHRLCTGGPHPTTAHHTNAAGTDSAVAAGNAGTKGPHGPGISGLSPPPPPVPGGSHKWGPRPFTRRTRWGDGMMRPGPRLTPAADAKATSGAGSRAPHDRQECHHNPNPNPNPNHSPNPNPSSSANVPGEAGATGDDLRANDGTGIQLRCPATSLDAFTAGDVATEPGALAIRAWAEGTRRN